MATSLNMGQKTFLKRIDWNLVLVIVSLNIIGLINLYSATHGAHSSIHIGRFAAQLMWLSVGWGLYAIVSAIDYRIFVKLSWGLYILNVICLALVPFIGKSFYGAKRWLDLGFFKYQPSETMKVILVLVLAQMLYKKNNPDGMKLKSLILPLIVMLIPFVLTVKQPDLGTALMFFAIGISMILFVGVSRKILMSSVLCAIVVLPIAWNFGLKEYQKNRVLTFLDPSRDPRGAGYNSIQSKIAVGSGRFLGKGFRKGTQSQLEFLPERHTDFIFSVLSEEHGFVGSMTTVGLFTILFLIGVRVATQARDRAGVLLCIGCLSMIFWHMFVNIGMVIGLLPIVGIPLPLLSYGGSNLLPTMVALGLVSSVAMRRYVF